MTRARTRVAALVVLAAAAFVAAAALRVGAPRPHRPGELFAGTGLPRIWHRVDTLGRGESLASLFARAGLGGDAPARALSVASGLDDRRIPAGMEVRFAGDSADPVPREISLQLAVDRILHLHRRGNAWAANEERIAWTTDTVVVHGVVRSTLYDALDAAAGALLPKGARTELAWALADIYDYRLDMSRDLQDGDSVRAVFERSRAANGAVRIGTIFAAGIGHAGGEIGAFRYTARGTPQAGYFDQNGRSLRASFLRAPLSFRRISSVFGMRKHPILGEWRNHKGTDYAAAAGTPVRSIGDGVVVSAGWRGGYGNCIDVRHPNGFVSRYGHLRGFASGIRTGTRVSMGQTIAYVGMTGLATGPHLHFEILVGGVQRDPRRALKAEAGTPLARADLGPFEAVRRQELAALDRPEGPVSVAVATP